MNLTQSRWLFFIMIGTGLITGAVFPFFVSLFAVVEGNVTLFKISCLFACVAVSLLHFLLIRMLVNQFKEIEKKNLSLCKEMSTDALTGVLNRRALEQQLLNIKNSSRKENTAILFVDIDNFSDFNNQYGHTQGDLVLAEISHLMSSHLRATDLIFRYGGEEFLILLPFTTKTEAYHVAEKLRKLVEDSSRATISIGVASFPEDSANIYEAIDFADKAMLAAKRSGKNRTSIYQPTGR